MNKERWKEWKVREKAIARSLRIFLVLIVPNMELVYDIVYGGNVWLKSRNSKDEDITGWLTNGKLVIYCMCPMFGFTKKILSLMTRRQCMLRNLYYYTHKFLADLFIWILHLQKCTICFELNENERERQCNNNHVANYIRGSYLR